jgi:hypothetical protein
MPAVVTLIVVMVAVAVGLGILLHALTLAAFVIVIPALGVILVVLVTTIFPTRGPVVALARIDFSIVHREALL